MKFRISVITLIILFMSALCFYAYSADVESVTVLSDDNYPPYIFRDESGSLQGIIPDQWKLWSERTGINVRLHAADWSRALEMMKNGKGDIIDTLFYSEERAGIFDYSKPYARIEVPVFFDNSISGINSIESLRGFVVAVKEGDACIDILRKQGVYSLRMYPSYEAIIRDASRGNIHVFCADKPPALYYIYRQGLEKKFNYSLTLYSGSFHRAVKKGDTSMLALLNRGFGYISENEYEEINEKWFGKEISAFRYFPYALPAAALFLSVIAVLFFLNLLLRKKVSEKTSELTEALKSLEKSEEKNRALLTANPDMLFVFDHEGNFVDYRSESMRDLYSSPDIFLGKNVKDVLPPGVAELTRKKISDVADTGVIQTYDYELQFREEPEYYESRMVPFGDDKYLAIVRNISERKLREDEIIRAHKLESLGIFAGGIAHDFNNIMTAVLGNISIARLSIDDKPKSLLWLERSEKAVLRARTLTEQLLAFSRGGAPIKETVYLPELIREYADFIVSGSGVAVRYSFGEDIPESEIDRGQIGQVIQNIVLNSIQAMPSGGNIAVSADSEFFEDDDSSGPGRGRYHKIVISDEGPGMPKEELQRIFDPYFTTKKNGSGLGLTITHTIIKRHGGTIRVSSEPGKGTSFIIYLPVVEEKEHKKEYGSRSGKSESIENLRVLVMDDETPLQMIMLEVLERSGARAEVASTGEELIEAFDRMVALDTPPDIVVSDLTIPGAMGGRDAVAELRKRGIDFRAIVTSGYSTDPVISQYREHGFDAYLLKPFSAEDFIETLKKVI